MHTHALLLGGFLGAHSLAGINPVAFSLQTEAFGRVGPEAAPLDVQTDLDVAASFFSSIESNALAQVGLDRGLGGASIAVTGDATTWTIQTFARGVGDSFDHSTQGWGEALFSASFVAAAGQQVLINGLVAFNGFADQSGWTNVFSLTLSRGSDVLEHLVIDRSGPPYYEDDVTVALDTFLDSAGEYTLDIRSFARGTAFAGPGVRDSSGRHTADLTVSIIPAPVTAAPLILGAAFATRRRRG
ncbi:MAG: hypothetical protein ACTS27_04820 [Phycisphaerales bacterium]